MSTVYVRWYGNILEGEVADGEGFMGMTPVRIPLDGHHPVALFMPQHVYESAEQAKMQSFPVNSPNSPRIPRKTEEEPREISRTESKVDTNDCLTPDDRYDLDVFKSYNWDDEHNHLRTDKIDEFYQMWREMLRPFGFVYDAEASVTCQSHTPKPVPVQHVPQNGTPTNTKQLHKKKPAKAMELSLFD